MKYAFATAVAIYGLSLFPALAQEAPPCAPFDVVERTHAEKWQETRIAQAVSHDGKSLLIVFASEGGASWSLVVVGEGGIACLKAFGNDWQVRRGSAPVSEEAL